ncbi:MAG: YitT family protein [Candidatus Kapaibacteriales bacterium]
MPAELRKSFSLSKIFFLILGVFSASFGLKSFLLPNKFIDGGVTGISMLSSVLLKIALPILIMLINLPFFISCFFEYL